MSMNVGAGKRGVVAAIAALLLAACGVDSPGDGGALQSTITLADAVRKVDDYAEQARQALGADVKFINPSKDYDFPCSNADGSPAKNWREASVGYQLGGVTPEQIPIFFQKIRTFWEKAGFAITDDDKKGPFLGARSNLDGFKMGLQANHLNEIYLNVSSPCVWRNGTPEPAN
ncbi:hypothetical protein ACFQ68_18845 [Amycolatopsis japonica]|uniref:hypothetical protein n=1 Tax=Amycolatopsis japonica TaxID=208439 RepID=UPI00366DE138